MAAADEATMMKEAIGELAELYKNGSERMRNLADKGWCVFPQMLGDPQNYIDGFNKDLEDAGFASGFGKEWFKPRAKDLPLGFWSIETCILPFCRTAVALRHDLRAAFAKELGIDDPETLVSSFDGVMCAYAGCMGVGKEAVPRQFDLDNPHLPICVTRGGGGHCDQSRFRPETSESFQMYYACTDAEHQDLCTVLLVPSGRWTIQAMRHVLELQFPEFYKLPKNGNTKVPGSISDEGYKLPKEHYDFLITNGIAHVIKPVLKAGDALFWSSALPHCAATGVSKKPRRARLGLITGFCPLKSVPAEVTKKRRKYVGGGYATGQQIKYAEKHGASFPSALSRFTKPENWPQAYKDLKRKREEYKTTPLYEARDDDDNETAEYRRKLRSLIGKERNEKRDDVLSKEDFELIASVGIRWITQAYDNDYATYLQEHAKECNPNWTVLDPFRRGLMGHPWILEDEIADMQKALVKEGKPLLKANTNDWDYFEDSFYGW